jgi:hypothetical protein
MILYYHSFYYVHLLYVSIQLDHYQAIFHEMYYLFFNYISMYFYCGSILVIINIVAYRSIAK